MKKILISALAVILVLSCMALSSCKKPGGNSEASSVTDGSVEEKSGDVSADVSGVESGDFTDAYAELVGKDNADAKYNVVLDSKVESDGIVLLTVSLNDITANDLVLSEFELHYDKSFNLIYDPEADIDDNGIFLIENYSVYPGEKGGWESMSILKDGYILVKIMTAGNDTAKNNGDVVISLRFAVSSGIAAKTVFWVPSSSVTGCDFDFNGFKGNGSYTVVEV
ncbi:MAG: hypothetical protein J5793_00970 [Clostridia bacterium]|nr:hypothetical protein [Clostridia bacterium]